MFHGFVRNSEICEIGYVGATIGRPAVTPYDFAWVFGESEECTARAADSRPYIVIQQAGCTESAVLSIRAGKLYASGNPKCALIMLAASAGERLAFSMRR